DGEPVRLDVNEQHLLAEGMTGDELAGPDAAGFDTRRQVRPDQLIGMFGHLCPFSMLRARSRCAAKAERAVRSFGTPEVLL
ncbi:MAG: hypothetical protein ACJ79N_01100, partial [Gemmatimonadaceae bacterium]